MANQSIRTFTPPLSHSQVSDVLCPVPDALCPPIKVKGKTMRRPTTAPRLQAATDRTRRIGSDPDRPGPLGCALGFPPPRFKTQNPASTFPVGTRCDPLEPLEPVASLEAPKLNLKDLKLLKAISFGLEISPPDTRLLIVAASGQPSGRDGIFPHSGQWHQERRHDQCNQQPYSERAGVHL